MKIEYVETTQDNLSNVPIQAGQVILTSDTHRQYLDFTSERKNLAFKSEVDDNTNAINAIVDEYGSKNLLPFFAVSTVIEDVTWTVHNAKKIITVNGTAANWSYQEGNKYPITLKAGQKYILSSGVDSSNQYNVYIDMYDAATITSLGKTIYGDIEYTPQTDTTVYFNVVVRTGVTVNNVVMKPMIRDARITDPTYVPYAMTNRELTEMVDRGSVSVTADGVKNMGALFDELMAMVDKNKLSESSHVLFNGKDCYRWQYTGVTLNIPFTQIFVENGGLYVYTLRYTTGGSSWFEYSSASGVQDKTAFVLSAGDTLSLHY